MGRVHRRVTTVNEWIDEVVYYLDCLHSCDWAAGEWSFGMSQEAFIRYSQ
jgi:hypothetical protein